VPVDTEGKEVVFKREPDFGRRKILRGALPVGPEETDFIGFAWDKAEGKLYLDLNQNLDLTDDPDGIRRTSARGFFQRFQNVHVELTVAGVRIPYVLDIEFYGPSAPSVCVRSGWQSEVELNGKKWLFGVVDNLDGTIGGIPSAKEPTDLSDLADFASLLGVSSGDVLILRSAEGSGESPVQTSPAASRLPVPIPAFLDQISDPDRFSVPQRLSFDGASYDLAFAFEPSETQTELVATFTEAATPTGELRITGQFIKRLVLEQDVRDGLSLVVLDSPDASVSLPEGEYLTKRVDVQDAHSNRLLRAEPHDSRVIIGARESANLKIGGPLSHDLSVDRRGRTLELSYLLLGAGGESYTDPDPNAQFLQDGGRAPRFTIYRAGQQIASGSFEYG